MGYMLASSALPLGGARSAHIISAMLVRLAPLPPPSPHTLLSLSRHVGLIFIAQIVLFAPLSRLAVRPKSSRDPQTDRRQSTDVYTRGVNTHFASRRVAECQACFKQSHLLLNLTSNYQIQDLTSPTTHLTLIHTAQPSLVANKKIVNGSLCE